MNRFLRTAPYKLKYMIGAFDAESTNRHKKNIPFWYDENLSKEELHRKINKHQTFKKLKKDLNEKKESSKQFKI